MFLAFGFGGGGTGSPPMFCICGAIGGAIGGGGGAIPDGINILG